MKRAIVYALKRRNEILLLTSWIITMNRFFLVFILILVVVNNANAKKYKKAYYLIQDYIEYIDQRGSEYKTIPIGCPFKRSKPSSNLSLPRRSYSSLAKPQITYECNGVIVTEDEYKKCNSAQLNDDKGLAIGVGDEKKITNSPKTTTAVAAEILDADIFQCSGKKQQKIKLYGIDAPEDGQSFYQEAKDMLKKFTHKKKITAKIYSQDSDGIDMAVVFANGKNVNELMVKSGHAWVRRDLCEEAFCDDWIESEEEAKSQEKGLWSDSGRIPPWVWK